LIIAAAASLPLAACKQNEGGVASAGSEAATPAGSGSVGANAGTTSSGSGATTGGSGSTSGGTSSGVGGSGIPALVNVNLENVLNDLSVRLQIDRANIPVNAQIPIDVAANVCGVSVSALSLSTGGNASCTAKTATPQLAQVVQQQVAAGGSVGGGAQGGSTATTGSASGSGGTSTSGSSGTGGTSTGTTETTTTPN
jgi:hypothetical protein